MVARSTDHWLFYVVVYRRRPVIIPVTLGQPSFYIFVNSFLLLTKLSFVHKVMGPLWIYTRPMSLEQSAVLPCYECLQMRCSKVLINISHFFHCDQLREFLDHRFNPDRVVRLSKVLFTYKYLVTIHSLMEYNAIAPPTHYRPGSAEMRFNDFRNVWTLPLLF